MRKIVSITRIKDDKPEEHIYYDNDKEVNEDLFYLQLSKPCFYEKRETFYFDDGFETRRTLLMEDIK